MIIRHSNPGILILENLETFSQSVLSPVCELWVPNVLTVVICLYACQAAMSFVFGGTFVCTDMDTAKKVIFPQAYNSNE